MKFLQETNILCLSFDISLLISCFFKIHLKKLILSGVIQRNKKKLRLIQKKLNRKQNWTDMQLDFQ